jgi:hypothetical protein
MKIVTPLQLDRLARTAAIEKICSTVPVLPEAIVPRTNGVPGVRKN